MPQNAWSIADNRAMGRRIRVALAARGLKIQQLAKRMKPQVTPQALSNAFSGRSTWFKNAGREHGDLLSRVARALSIPIEALYPNRSDPELLKALLGPIAEVE